MLLRHRDDVLRASRAGPLELDPMLAVPDADAGLRRLSDGLPVHVDLRERHGVDADASPLGGGTGGSTRATACVESDGVDASPVGVIGLAGNAGSMERSVALPACSWPRGSNGVTNTPAPIPTRIAAPMSTAPRPRVCDNSRPTAVPVPGIAAACMRASAKAAASRYRSSGSLSMARLTTVSNAGETAKLRSRAGTGSTWRT